MDEAGETKTRSVWPENRKVFSKEKTLELLDLAKANLNHVIDPIQEIPEDQKEINTDETYFDVKSNKYQSGKFAFWGGLEDSSAFPKANTNSERVPVIKNLRIPEELRDKGVGRTIVESWEAVFANAGISTSLAININGENIDFWKKMGYVVPEDQEYKKNPYYMYKKI